jgi:hypothetical protein
MQPEADVRPQFEALLQLLAAKKYLGDATIDAFNAEAITQLKKGMPGSVKAVEQPAKPVEDLKPTEPAAEDLKPAAEDLKPAAEDLKPAEPPRTNGKQEASPETKMEIAEEAAVSTEAAKPAMPAELSNTSESDESDESDESSNNEPPAPVGKIRRLIVKRPAPRLPAMKLAAAKATLEAAKLDKRTKRMLATKAQSAFKTGSINKQQLEAAILASKAANDHANASQKAFDAISLQKGGKTDRDLDEKEGALDLSAGALYPLMTPIFDYLRIMYDPVYSVLDKFPQGVSIAQLLPLLQLCMQIRTYRNGSTIKPYGVYRLKGLDHEVVEFITAQLGATKEHVMRIEATEGAVDEWIQHVFRLPQVQLSSIREMVAKSNDRPYIHFMRMGVNATLGEVKVKDFFHDDELYIICTNAIPSLTMKETDTATTQIPLVLIEVDMKKLNPSRLPIKTVLKEKEYLELTFDRGVIFNDAELYLRIMSLVEALYADVIEVVGEVEIPVEAEEAVEAVEAAEDLKPVEAVEAAEDLKPVEAVEAAEDLKPVEAVEAAEDLKPVEPAEDLKPVEPVEAVEAVEPVEPAKNNSKPAEAENAAPVEPKNNADVEPKNNAAVEPKNHANPVKP